MGEREHGTVLGGFRRAGEDAPMRGRRRDRPPDGEHYARVVGVSRLWAPGYGDSQIPVPKAVLHVRILTEDGRSFDAEQWFTESMFRGSEEDKLSPANLLGVFTGLSGRDLTDEECAEAVPGDLRGVLAKVVVGKGAKGGFRIWSWSGVTYERGRWIRERVPDDAVRGFTPNPRTMARMRGEEKKALRLAKKAGMEIEPGLQRRPAARRETAAPPRTEDVLPAPPVQMPEPEDEAPPADEPLRGDDDDDDIPF